MVRRLGHPHGHRTSAVSTPTTPPPPVPYASFADRLLGAVADLSLLGVVSVVARLAVLIPLVLTELTAIETLASDPTVPASELEAALVAAVRDAAARTAAVFLALSLVSNLAYFTLQERSRAGATLGKRVARVVVVDQRTFGRVSTRQALVRTLAKYLSALPLFVGYLAMVWDPQRRTWHDRLAGTAVIRRPTRPGAS